MSKQSGHDVKVVIEDGETRARIIIPDGLSPDEVTPVLLETHAESAGVRIDHGIRQRLAQLAERYANESQRLDEVFANGQPPVHGVDGYIQWKPEFDPDGATAEAGGEAATSDTHAVDHYAGKHFVAVKKDDHVATLHEPTDGEDGLSVTGELLKAKPGKKCPIRCEPDYTVDTDGQIIAQQDGVIQLTSDRLEVTKLLEVPEYVDFETGNIDFDGSVDIREGIRDRFIVKAAGDVSVGGLIESATIICNGNLTSRRGIAARRDQGKIVVHGNLEIGFLNNVRGLVHGHAVIRREIINTELIVGEDLHCPQGSMIGGRVVVGGSIDIGTIGSDGHRPTVLRVGTLPILTDTIQKLSKQIKQWMRELTNAQERLVQLEQMGKMASALDREQSTELHCIVADLEQQIEDGEEQRQAYLDQLATQRSVKVIVSRMVYAKTSIETDSQIATFLEDVRGPIKFGWSERGALTYQIADGPIQPITTIAQVRQRQSSEETKSESGEQPSMPTPV